MSLMTVQQIADLAADDTDNIYQFVREDRIPYLVGPDGILIPFGGFQTCMNDLYDLSASLRAIGEKIGTCHHDSMRVDGTLDTHCLRCGTNGYWHDGHRHDRYHPSGKVLISLEC